jgi:hypothetical protein
MAKSRSVGLLVEIVIAVGIVGFVVTLAVVTPVDYPFPHNLMGLVICTLIVFGVTFNYARKVLAGMRLLVFCVATTILHFSGWLLALRAGYTYPFSLFALVAIGEFSLAIAVISRLRLSRD